MANLITPEDIISPLVASSVKDLASQIRELSRDTQENLKAVQEEARKLASTLSSTRGTEAISSQSAEVEKLYKQYESLNERLNKLTKSYDNHTSATEKKAEKTRLLIDALAKLDKQENQAVLLAQKLVTTQKEQNRVDDLTIKAAREKENSFNRLSAVYGIVKSALNAMTVAERESTEQGKQLTAFAANLMSQMDGLQRATGKYNLSVGHYENSIKGAGDFTKQFAKEFNGLNIATQQVARELPTLANSFSLFIIAISNNIPIFLDQAKAFRTATGSLSLTIQGVIRSLISWQTVVIGVLTVLPGLIRKINEKKKAQEEDNKVTKEAITLAKQQADYADKLAKKINAETSDLRTLLAIANDSNRTREEQVSALDALVRKYPKVFEGMEKEKLTYDEIKAKVVDYIQQLTIQAEVETKLAQIRENNDEKVKLYRKVEEASTEKNTKAFNKYVAAHQAYNNALEDRKKILAGDEAFSEDDILTINRRVEAAGKRLKRAKEEWENTDVNVLRKQIEVLSKDNENLTNDITKLMLDSINEVTTGTTRRTKETLDELGNYYFEWQESIARTTLTGEELSVRLIELRYEKEIKAAKDRLAEEIATGRLEESSRRQQNEIILNLETEKGNAILAERKKWEKKRYDTDVAAAKEQLKIETNQATVEHQNFVRRDKAAGEAEVRYWEERIRIAKEYGGEYENELTYLESELEKAREKALTGTAKGGEVAKKRTGGFLYQILFGEAEKEDKPTEQLANYVSKVKSAFSTTIGYMNDIIAKREEMAQKAVEQAQREKDAAKDALDYEMEARANGYANSVETAKREYNDRLALERQALEQKKQVQKAELAMESASQVASLVSAAAGIFKGYASIPLVGQILGAAAVAAMFASFTAAKITANQAVDKYGEGTVELLEGGSHASGNDIDLGRKKNGTRRRAEGGEYFAVINKRNSRKYGKIIPDVINSLNNGTFGEKYQRASEIMDAGLAMSLISNGTDVSLLERDVKEIRQQGERARYLDGSGNTIEVYKNMTRRIIKS